MNDAAVAAVDHILLHCGGANAASRILIVSDPGTVDVASLLVQRARHISPHVEACEIPRARAHGVEPPAGVREKMLASDLCLGLTTMSLAHTAARRAFTDRGGRYLSLPEYSIHLLSNPAIMVDYRVQAPTVRRVAAALTNGTTLRVTSKAGTDVTCHIAGRTGNYCPGFVESAGDLGSPPDIEANVSPIETASEGVIVVDGSIPCPEVGLLSHKLRLDIEGGRIVRITSENEPLAETVQALFSGVGDGKSYVLAEVGIGLNPKAELCGIMLTDEGAYGNIHFGFGSNATVGGENDVPFHLDFVCRRASLHIDDKLVIENGVLLGDDMGA